jgi:ariadne-1
MDFASRLDFLPILFELSGITAPVLTSMSPWEFSEQVTRLVESGRISSELVSRTVLRPVACNSRTNSGDDDQEVIIDDDSEEFPAVEYVPTSLHDTRAILTANELVQLHEQMAADETGPLNVHQDLAFHLLGFFSWDVDRLNEAVATDRQKVFRECGIDPGWQARPFRLAAAARRTECPICYDDKPAWQVAHLPCGHDFCLECWEGHILSKVSEMTTAILCPSHGCGCPVSMYEIRNVCGAEVAQRYHQKICENEIGRGTKIHCMRPDCPFVLTANSVGPCGVATCRCGDRICWACKKVAHAPVTCAQQQEWGQVAGQAEDVVQGMWERQNTKECPRCRNRIEKNGGCNHMTCSQCRHQFC